MGGPPRTVQAIVVGRHDFREADRVVRLLTPDRGRMAAVARGARRSRRRHGGVLDVTNRVELVVVQGRGALPWIREAALVHGHPHLRADLDRVVLATYATELVAALAREDHPEPRLFGLLEVALLVLDACTGPPSPVFRWGLEAKALAFAGLAPRLEACAVCGQPAEGGAWSCAAGGLVHPACEAGPTAPAPWVRQVRRALRSRLVELVDEAPEAGPDRALADLAAWHLGRPLRSLDLLAGG